MVNMLAFSDILFSLISKYLKYIRVIYKIHLNILCATLERLNLNVSFIITFPVVQSFGTFLLQKEEGLHKCNSILYVRFSLILTKLQRRPHNLII